METKGLTCKIPLELHNQISEDIRAAETTDRKTAPKNRVASKKKEKIVI